MDPDKAEEALAGVIDALHDGASHGECDVDVITEKQVIGYRQRPSSPAVVAAEARAARPRLRAAPDRHRRRVGRERLRGRRPPVRQRRQRHRAQPRADRARVRRRARVDARRRASRCSRRPPRHELPLRAHRHRDDLRGQVLRRRARPLPPRGRRGGGPRARRPPRRGRASSCSTATSCGSSASRARPSASPTCSRSRPASSTRRARTRWRPPSASSPRRSASRPPTGSRSARSSPRRASRTRRSTSSSPPGISDVDERPEVEEDERIDVEVRPLSDLDSLLATNQDSKTLVALARLKAPRWRTASRGAAPHAAVAHAGRLHGQGAAAKREGPPMAVADARSTAPAAAEPFEHLVLDFLAYLEFERGLSRNTLEAYRSDLLQYGAYLAGRDALAVTHSDLAGFVVLAGRRRRREAAGVARDAAAQGRVPALVPPPPAPPGDPRRRPDRQPARARSRAGGCRTCSRRDEVAKLLEQPRGTEPAALRDRALLELMYACGLRASEAIDLETTDVDLEAGILQARGKGSKERIVPVGSAATRAVNAYLARGPRAARRRPARVAPVRQPPRHRPDAPGALQDRPAPRRHRRARGPDEPAHAAAHVRDPPAGRRLRPALAAGDARPRRHRHDPALHAPLRRPPEGRLLRGAPAREVRARNGGCHNRRP